MGSSYRYLSPSKCRDWNDMNDNVESNILPKSLGQCPSLVWVGTHAMLCATPRVALPERGLQTESVAQRHVKKNSRSQRVATGRHGSQRVKCLSPRPQPSSSSRSARFPTAKGKKSTKVEPEKSFTKTVKSCKFRVDLKIRWINSSVFSSKFLLDWMPFRMVFLTMSPTCPSWRVHREHRNLELPGPSLRNGNLGNWM